MQPDIDQNYEPTLRPARAEDSDLLFSWVNTPDARSAALNDSGPVAREIHEAWFAEHLQDRQCRIWIIERAGDPAGVVRLEGPAEAVVVSIFVAEGARRGGVAHVAIGQALDDMARTFGAYQAIARVRVENHASRRLFEALGFAVAETRPDHVVYRRAGPVPVSA